LTVPRRIPFVLPTAAEQVDLLRLFERTGFTEAGIRDRLGLESIHDFTSVGRGRTPPASLADGLDLFVHLFMDGLSVAAHLIEEGLPSGGGDLLRRLGLLEPLPSDDGRIAATVFLYPMRALYIASDLDAHGGGGVWTKEELYEPDHVFSAINPLTGTFLEQLPTAPCDRFLELCAGTGAAALEAARRCGHAWSADITERSTRFAEFNARLNGIENFTAVRGDLYEAVRGQTFDCIVAHPPYIPATSTRMIFRDGGEDGEQIFRKVIAGLPDHLAPGGVFCCTCTVTDRTEGAVEQRIRSLLGEHQGEFDLLLAIEFELPMLDYCHRTFGPDLGPTVFERAELYGSLGVERVMGVSLSLRRHGGTRAPFTLRRNRSPGATGRDAERYLSLVTALTESSGPETVLLMRCVLSPHTRLRTSYLPGEGGWAMEQAGIEITHPFVGTSRISPAAATMLWAFDGTRTVREVLERLREGADAVEVGEEAFAAFVRQLLVDGVLVPSDSARNDIVEEGRVADGSALSARAFASASGQSSAARTPASP
jgi:precorrin-6B methylase 2